MRILIKRNTIIEIVAGLFILLFVYTAISKLAAIPEFTAVLGKSPLLKSVAPIVAWGVPITELAITIVLFFPKFRKIGLYSSAILMGLFTGYLIYMIYFTPDLPCSCGGVIGYMTWKQHLLFNVFFTALGILGIILDRSNIVSKEEKDASLFSPI